MSHTRGKRIKELQGNAYSDPQLFYVSLEEAKSAIASEYEFLDERYDQQASVKRVKPTSSL